MDKETEAQLTTILTLMLAALLIASLAGVVYIALTPSTEEDAYTEFYIMGSGGNASNYPTNLSIGETGELIVGITNNEHREMTYTVVLVLGDEPVAERTVDVGDGRTWKDEVQFSPEEAGEKQLDVLLYIGGDADLDAEPYRELQLTIHVSEGK